MDAALVGPAHAGQLAGDIKQRRETKGKGSTNRHVACASIALPGEARKVSGVDPGEARDRERPAPVGAAIGKALDQGVRDSRAEPIAFAERGSARPTIDRGKYRPLACMDANRG
jgi:hypothetical protein